MLQKTLRQAQGDGERDAVGMFTVSFADWSNAVTILWQRPAGCYWEFYYDRTGSIKFALAVLDRDDDAEHVWSELNGVRL